MNGYAISMPCDAVRSARREAIAPVKEHFQRLQSEAAWLCEVRDLRAANRSTQYVGELHYESCLSEGRETIRVEIGLREPLLSAAQMVPAGTLLRSPLTRQPALEPIPVHAMSRSETYAEKIRAALCRREAAIRDFYDLDYAFRSGVLRTDDRDLLHLVRAKIAIPGNDAPDLSPQRIDTLRRQIKAQLRPVLRETDFQQFALDRIVAILQSWKLGA